MSKEVWQLAKNCAGEREVLLGPYFSHQVLGDTGHLLFTLSRYKFASRMLPLEPDVRVLELGCNEGLGTMILAEKAGEMLAVDFDDKAIAHAAAHMQKANVSFRHADFLSQRFGAFDAVVSLDVVEHIDPADAPAFFATLTANLAATGLAVIGTPNATAAAYASEASRLAHVNLYDAPRLYAAMREHFANVFIFGMNDEVLHTGFHPMCHYLFALGCSPLHGDAA